MNYLRSFFASRPVAQNRIYLQGSHIRYKSELDPLLAYTSLKNVPLILNFSAPWCQTCKDQSPVIERLFAEEQIGERLDYVEIKSDEAEMSEYLIRFGIKTFPTLVGIQREFLSGTYQVRSNSTREELLDFLKEIAQKGAKDRK